MHTSRLQPGVVFHAWKPWPTGPRIQEMTNGVRPTFRILMSGFLLVVLPVPLSLPPTSKQGQFCASFFALEGRRELREVAGEWSESKKGLHEDLSTNCFKGQTACRQVQSRDLENLDRTWVRRNAGGEQERRPRGLKRFLDTVSL